MEEAHPDIAGRRAAAGCGQHYGRDVGEKVGRDHRVVGRRHESEVGLDHDRVGGAGRDNLHIVGAGRHLDEVGDLLESHVLEHPAPPDPDVHRGCVRRGVHDPDPGAAHVPFRVINADDGVQWSRSADGRGEP